MHRISNALKHLRAIGANTRSCMCMGRNDALFHLSQLSATTLVQHYSKMEKIIIHAADAAFQARLLVGAHLLLSLPSDQCLEHVVLVTRELELPNNSET